MEPESKKAKTIKNEASAVPPLTEELPRCQHFVVRKKRFCKMTVAKGKEYCGEHEPQQKSSADGINDILKKGRIPCPLDNRHTVNEKNLRKHLIICNARPIENPPPYIVPGINCGDNDGSSASGPPIECPKLGELPPSELKALTNKVKEIYAKYVHLQVVKMNYSHCVLKEELANEEYGFETMRHLIQTASLIGCLEDYGLLKESTSFIEFGAGKGHLSYWLAQALIGIESSKVILIDRMSHRHKMDNKIEDRDTVQRIRADIADFKMSELDILKESKSVVAVSKHLCGAATDLAIRCVLQDTTQKTEAILIALCCHHRCEWKPFVGKEFFLENGFNQMEFALITKMASWAICGSGMSRDRRKLMDDEEFVRDVTVDDVAIKERSEIGFQCKRLIDYSRVDYLRRNGFTASLNSYVVDDVTLENVCILALRQQIKIE